MCIFLLGVVSQGTILTTKTTFNNKGKKIFEDEKTDRRHYYSHTHTHASVIMFAATQQIASVAGLKATKVQVRRNARFFDVVVFVVPFFRFFFPPSARDRRICFLARCGGCVSLIQSGIPKRVGVVPRAARESDRRKTDRRKKNEKKRDSRACSPRRSVHQKRRGRYHRSKTRWKDT